MNGKKVNHQNVRLQSVCKFIYIIYRQKQKVSRLYVFRFGWRVQGETSNLHDPRILFMADAADK